MMKRQHRSATKRALGSAAIALAASAQSMAQYAPGFTWNRFTDYQPGVFNNSAENNPNVDAMGNPVWHYGWVAQSGATPSTPWFALQPTTMVWREALLPRWERVVGESPIVDHQTIHTNNQFDSQHDFAPVVTWQNPVGAPIVLSIVEDPSIAGSSRVSWCCDNAADPGPVEVVLGIKRIDIGATEILFFESIEKPTPDGSNEQALTSLVDIESVSLGANDELIFAMRKASDLTHNEVNGWFESMLVLTLIEIGCLGDADSSNSVDFGDVTAVLGNWLADYSPGTGPGDTNGDSVVDFGDVTTVLGNWLAECP